MTTSMCKIICVSNRHLCTEPFEQRLASVIKAGVDALILREKDLSETEYLALAERVLPLCEGTATTCILHSFPGVAHDLHYDKIHLPLPLLRSLSNEEREAFTVLGASCHSLADVEEATKLGCTYVTLGHIFATNCKKDLKPRGLPFLQSICEQAHIPVYAIGGIHPHNVATINNAGAQGACIMSDFMICDNPSELLHQLKAMQ